MSVRTTSAVRRRLAVWSVLPLLALSSACGGDEGQVADPQDSSASESETSDRPYDEDTIIPAMQEALGEATSAQIDMDMSGQVEMSIGGQVAMTEEFEEAEMELAVDFQGQTLELRQVDGLIYVSGPPATPAGKWVAVDPQDTKNPMAQQFSSLTRTGDINSTFDAFREGLQKVEHVGEEEIDGEATDHYLFTVDSAKAAEAQGQAMPPGAPEQLTYDVWLTDDDLMRRVSFQLGQVEAVVNATDWGEPVEVAAPAKGDIIQGPGA